LYKRLAKKLREELLREDRVHVGTRCGGATGTKRVETEVKKAKGALDRAEAAKWEEGNAKDSCPVNNY